MAQSENKRYLEKEHEKNRAEWKSADASGNTYAEPMKMVYKAHNLKNNYLNASGDDRMKRDILMSEIAKLIVSRTNDVVGLLRKAGFNVPEKPKQKHLVKAVVNGMHKSKRFTSEIMRMIAKGEKRVSADGTTSDYGSILGSASDLINGAGNLFGGKKKAKAQAAASEAERKKLEAEAALEKIKGENALMGAVKGVGGDLGSNIGRNIAIGIGVGTLLGTGIWYLGFRGK